MTWGGSYSGMALRSVSIVNLASNSKPAAFNKINPANTGTSVRNATLSWQASTEADSYFYCIDQTPGTACTTSWITTNANTSVSVGTLALGTTYYWQVYAHNSIGDTYANGGNWYSFTAVQTIPVYLPLISKPVPPPVNFNKISPANGAGGQSTSPTLSWGASSGAVSYEYCPQHQRLYARQPLDFDRLQHQRFSRYIKFRYSLLLAGARRKCRRLHLRKRRHRMVIYHRLTHRFLDQPDD